MFARRHSRSPVTSKITKRGSACLLEGLEMRRMFSIYNPQGVPAVAMTEGIANTGIVVGTFASTDPLGGLSATISWGPQATPSASVGAINLIGSVFVPGVGTVPQYSVTGGTTEATATSGGSNPFTVTISDSSDATNGVITGATTVLDAPLTTTGGIASASVTEGAAVNYTGAISLMTFTDANPNSTAADFQAKIDWGDGSPATLGTITKAGATYSVAGRHTYPSHTTGTPFTLTVSVADAGGSSATHHTSITVTDAALSGPTAVPLTGTTGQTLQNVLIGTFLDGNPLGSAADLSATIDWGDGVTSDPASIVLIGGTGSSAKFGVYGTHTYTDSAGSPYAITASVSSDGGATTTINSIATITDPTSASTPLVATAAPVVVQEGTTVPAGTVFGSISDGHPLGGIVYTATALVNGTSVPLAVSGTAGNYVLTAASDTTIAAGLQVGGETFVLNVSGDNSTSAIAFGSVTVAAAPLTLLGTFSPGLVTEGLSLSTGTLLKFTDANPSASAGDFQATIDWGDGTTPSVGTVTFVSGQYNVSGTHVFAHAASGLQVHVTVVGVSGQHVSGTTPTFDVGDASISAGTTSTVTGTLAQPIQRVLLGTFTDPNPYGLATDFSASINWGDGTGPDTGAIVPLGGTAQGVTFGVYGDHTYAHASNQPYDVAFTVTNKDAVSGTTFHASAVVRDAALTARGLAVAGVEGQSIAGAVATFRYANPDASASDLIADITWGDGSSSAGTIVADGSGNYHVDATHAYSDRATGKFAVGVTIEDVDGGSVTTATSATVTNAALTARPLASSLTVKRNVSFTRLLGSFLDANGLNTSTAPYLIPGTRHSPGSRIDWGDGTVTALTAANLSLVSTDASGGLWSVAGRHRYRTAGAKVVHVYVRDDAGAATVITLTINVKN